MSRIETERLDIICATSGLSKSREQARKEIIAGWVTVDGETVHTPSKKVKKTAVIAIDRPGGRYVSRGGEKLHRALQVFAPEINDCCAVDLGASTGGFTHCLLEHGARKVYAVDVGYGQFDYSLRNDSRVVLYERTNVKNLTADHFHEPVEFIVMDLSFISVTKVVPILTELFPRCPGIMLVKPQFEAEPHEQKKGVVKKKEYHHQILKRTVQELASKGIGGIHCTWSPIKGPKGNIEFLLYFQVGGEPSVDPAILTQKAVEEAWGELQ